MAYWDWNEKINDQFNYNSIQNQNVSLVYKVYEYNKVNDWNWSARPNVSMLSYNEEIYERILKKFFFVWYCFV